MDQEGNTLKPSSPVLCGQWLMMGKLIRSSHIVLSGKVGVSKGFGAFNICVHILRNFTALCEPSCSVPLVLIGIGIVHNDITFFGEGGLP